VTDRLLLSNAQLVDLDPPGVTAGHLWVEDGRIVERLYFTVLPGPVPSVAPGEVVVDLEGDLLMPGMVNAHTHLYSALVPGMVVPPVEDFQQALEQLWWVVDRCHDEETIAASALAGAVEAIRCGTTTLVDHHASPDWLDGSLDALFEGADPTGIRLVSGYEITDRNGNGEGARSLAENLRAQGVHASETRAVLTALHASFTIDDLTLAAVASTEGPIHIHVAEGRVDVQDAQQRGHAGVIDRLEAFGLLRQGSVLAHGVHLDDDEVRRVKDAGCFLVHNPSSNRNNRVGHAAPERFGDALALGTDGIGSDMWGAMRDAFLAAREHNGQVDPLQAMVGGHRLASGLLGVPLGRLQPGHAADLVRVRAPVRGPVESSSLFGHLLFGLGPADVRDVWIAGQLVLDRGEVVGLSASARRGVAQQAERLWSRFAERSRP
jgi:cytosine/adenosine deaminase-related metal-dependent hydrolase